jgi:hypothetical protein
MEAILVQLILSRSETAEFLMTDAVGRNLFASFIVSCRQ